MYQMLVRRQWRIVDTCPQLIAAIPSRVHDPKKPGDLLKVSGDPLDDVSDATCLKWPVDNGIQTRL